MERTPSGFRIEITHGHKYKLRPDARGEDVWTEATACELELWALVQAQERELANWKTWGIVEIAMRNSNVSSYVEHWEGRATSAEVKLQAQEERIANQFSEIFNLAEFLKKSQQHTDEAEQRIKTLESRLAGLISAAKAGALFIRNNDEFEKLKAAITEAVK